MLPAELQTDPDLSDAHFEQALKKNYPIMLYLHGTAGTRAAWHRVQLYRRLADMNFHVFAFDYRGTCKP